MGAPSPLQSDRSGATPSHRTTAMASRPENWYATDTLRAPGAVNIDAARQRIGSIV